jgi:hypothetical protein
MLSREQIEWHGSHGYASCPVCGQFMRVTGATGGWHFCLTTCERYGHKRTESDHRFLWWRWRTFACTRCSYRRRRRLPRP